MSAGSPFGQRDTEQVGQRLQCPSCGSEVEIVVPSTSSEGLRLRCCGGDMVRTATEAGRSRDA